MTNNNVLFVVENVSSRFGGQAYSVPSLFFNFTSSGNNATLVSGYQHLLDLKNVLFCISSNFNFKFRYINKFKISFSYAFWLIFNIHKFTHIHINGIFSFFFLYTYIISYFTNKIIIICPRGMLNITNDNRNIFFKFYIKIVYYIMNNCHLVHCTSFVERNFIYNKYSFNNLFVLSNGFSPLENSKFIKKSSSILYVGRICAHKNLLNLIYALDTLGVFNNYKLDIIGNFDNEFFKSKFLSDKVFKKNQSRICLHGFISRENLSSYYAQANYFVCPSISENFGLSILDALSFNLPCLVPTDSPWSSYINDYNIVDTNPDYQSLLENIPKLFIIANKSSTNDLVKNFYWQNIIIKFKEKLFQHDIYYRT